MFFCQTHYTSESSVRYFFMKKVVKWCKLSGYKNINCVSSEEVFVLDIPCEKCYNKAKGSDAQWNTTEL